MKPNKMDSTDGFLNRLQMSHAEGLHGERKKNGRDDWI